MFESFILGAVQGISEWLPISSEAMIVLVKTNFFPNELVFSELISFAIFLHLGTLLAVVVYYWKKIRSLLHDLVHYQSIEVEKRRYLNFIVVATAVSGILGLLLIKIVERYESWFAHETTTNMVVALFLIVTAVLLYISEQKKYHHSRSLTKKRALITGLFQGFAAIPGISRSGSTIGAMALLGINKERALELSFILSIPIVLLANIVLNLDQINSLNIHNTIALASSFVFGILTIELLLRFVRRVRFSYFVGVFAIILIVLTFVVV